MVNLLKCLTCKNILTSEEVKNHICKVTINKFRTIIASSYFTVKNDDGEDCISIDALNGIGYTFIVKQPKLMALLDNLANDQPTGNTDKTTDNETAPINRHL